jgi:hypothetical protein
MGTKMTPCLASLFMGKLEKEFIDSCDKNTYFLTFSDDFLFHLETILDNTYCNL